MAMFILRVFVGVSIGVWFGGLAFNAQTPDDEQPIDGTVTESGLSNVDRLS